MNLVHWLVTTCLLFTSCIALQKDAVSRSWHLATERINAKHKSDLQLKVRLTQVGRELSKAREGEPAWPDINALAAERDAIRLELLHRYESGDRDAWLPAFAR